MPVTSFFFIEDWLKCFKIKLNGIPDSEAGSEVNYQCKLWNGITICLSKGNDWNKYRQHMQMLWPAASNCADTLDVKGYWDNVGIPAVSQSF